MIHREGADPEADRRRLVRHRINRRNDIVQRFRWRRHHNFERDERQGVPIEEGRTVGRRPRHKEPIPLPKSVGAIKDWRYYRRTGATWTDLYNTPERRIKLTGLVTKDSLRADIAGLEHICAVVADEQRAAMEEEARRHARARELRTEFLRQIAENKRKPGGSEYVPATHARRDDPLDPAPPAEEPQVREIRSPREAWHQNAGNIRKENLARVLSVSRSAGAGVATAAPPAARPASSPGPRPLARARSGERTAKLARGVHDMNQRRRLFNKLGCQDMKGLLVTDRGLAVHINRLAKELDVQVPTYPFIPEPPHVSQKVRS